MGQQNVYELVLFLFCRSHCWQTANRSICFIECVSGYKQSAYINFKVCSLVDKRHPRQDQQQQQAHNSSSEHNSNQQRGAGNDSKSIKLQAVLNKCVERICSKQLKSFMSSPSIEIVDNISITQQRLFLPDGSSSVVEGVRSLSHESSMNHQWLLIEHYSGNSDGLISITRKLQQISVPTVSIHAHQFGDISNDSFPFSAVVMHEGMIAKLSHALLMDILQSGICTVVVCDTPKAPQDIQKIYGMQVTASLTTTATVTEVFLCVQVVQYLIICPLCVFYHYMYMYVCVWASVCYVTMLLV